MSVIITATIAIVLAVLSTFLTITYSRSSKPASQIPLHRFEDRPDEHESYITATRQLHEAGYKKYSKHGHVYRVRTSAGGERIILPPQYLQEVKNASQSTASLPEEMSHLLLMKYTGVPQRTDAGTKVVRVDMTRQLGTLITAMDEECTHAFRRCLTPLLLPGADSWTEVTIYPILAQIVAQISGRVLVGPELCRNEEWLRISISFSTHAFGAARLLRAENRYPWSMLWHSCFSEPVQRISSERMRAAALLRPICEQRLKEMRHPGDPSASAPPRDANQWLLESHADSGESIEEVVKSQLRLTMAAIHNTTMAITNDLFDLLANPEYVQCLREEVESVLAAEGGWTKQALTKMRKLDSFMKESARMNPTTMLTVKRKVLKDLALNDGLVIAAGSHIAFASDGMNKDPDIYTDPESFHGLRFHELNGEALGSDGVHNSADAHNSADETQTSSPSPHLQYVTATATYLNWGGGKSACPGRFFASNEIKLMLAYMLQHYDFEWRAGESRPESLVNDWNILPDRNKVVLVRARNVE